MPSLLDRKGIILNLNVEEAVNILIEKKYGFHLLLIYPCLEVVRQFYSIYTQKEVDEHNGMIVIAPFYETTKDVRSTLSNSPVSVDIAKHEIDRTITIVDATILYSAYEGSSDLMKGLTHHAKTLGKKGVTLIGDKGLFYDKAKREGIVEDEISFLSKEYSMDKKIFCLYHQKDLDGMSNEQKQLLYENHIMIIQLDA